MQIRNERSADWPQVNALLNAAFPTAAEAQLVARLRGSASPLVALVAEEHNVVIGYILFTPVTLESTTQHLMGLAPLAVLPARQQQGIGTALVHAGLRQCRLSGVNAVFVLGHADYYPRFGFTPTAAYGIRSDYDVPAENFMMLQLNSKQNPLPHGAIHYHPEFAKM